MSKSYTLLKSKLPFVIFGFFILLFAACDDDDTTESTTTATTTTSPIISYQVVKTYPHDTDAFTEGLFFAEGKLYESTGGTREFPQSKSLFGIVDTATGKINAKVTLDKNLFFGEGIALLNNKIYQLTYTTRVGFIYDATTYKKLGEFKIPSAEGWGLTTNGTDLIMSDGTNKLTYLDPENLQTIKTITVSDNGYAVDLLNELEYVKGFLYANVYTSNMIVKIDPTTGNVVGKMDLTNIAIDARNNFPRAIDMNGIAYDAATDKFLVTGKFWPKMYEISFAK